MPSIVTDDNPRGEDGDRSWPTSLPVSPIRRRGRAARPRRGHRAAIGEAGPNDIVLIAGKGHEPYQEINGVQHPFDDTRSRPAPAGGARMKPLQLSDIARMTGGRLRGDDA
jgi:UDP-N-acetylmuramoyl-L-alanyl-D-glutamate--2,6-diaminopimelate ligase